jgi:hypothetical protein
MQQGRQRTACRGKDRGVEKRAAKRGQAMRNDGESTEAIGTPEDLATKLTNWEIYVDIIAKDDTMGVPGVMMIEGGNGDEGITVREGHVLTENATGAKGLMSRGYHEMARGAADGDFGQEKKVKGAAKRLSDAREGRKPRGSERV